MQFKITFCLDLRKEKFHVTVEVECTDEPQISGNRQLFVIRPVSHFDVIESESSKGWKDYFTVSVAFDEGVLVYTDDDCHYFYMELPKKIQESVYLSPFLLC